METLIAALGLIGTVAGFGVALAWRRKAQFWHDMHDVEVAFRKSQRAEFQLREKLRTGRRVINFPNQVQAGSGGPEMEERVSLP